MITTQTKKFAVIGDPIAHSASPKMHNSVFNTINIDGIYLAMHITPSQLKSTLPALKTLGFQGINVTIPHKETILNYCDTIDDLAQTIGAINTVVLKNNQWHGYNTDAPGFIYAIETQNNFSLNHKTITIIGAGGTAKALSIACLNSSITSLNIINRTLTKANTLKDKLSTLTTTPIATAQINSATALTMLKQSNLVINTTPIGMHPNTTDCPLADMTWVTPKHFCFDVIYTPATTSFLNQAKHHQAKTANGLSMLAAQAMYAFKHFTNQTVDFNHFYSAITT